MKDLHIIISALEIRDAMVEFNIPLPKQEAFRQFLQTDIADWLKENAKLFLAKEAN